MLQAEEAEAAPAEAAPKPKPKKKPEKKDEGKSGVTVNVEKTSSLRGRIGTSRIAYGLGKMERSLMGVRKALKSPAVKDTTDLGALPENIAYHLGKHRRKYQAGGAALGVAEAGRRISKAKKEKEKTSSPFFKAASLRERGIGALVGGAGAAALQARSDRKGPGGKSERELIFKAKLQALKGKKDPSLTDQYKKIMYRAYGDLAEVHRKNPKAAMAMSGAAGAATGAMIAPTAAQIGRQMFRR